MRQAGTCNQIPKTSCFFFIFIMSHGIVMLHGPKLTLNQGIKQQATAKNPVSGDKIEKSGHTAKARKADVCWVGERKRDIL